jgi:hypothetical protein
MCPSNLRFVPKRIPVYISKKFLMKRIFCLLFVISLMSVVGCKEKSHEKDHGHNAEAPDNTAEEESPNIALHDEVMKVHDEVMPKLDDIYKKKEALKNKIASTPNMPEAQKKDLEARIAKLDSASDGMFKWMHEFRPLADSVGEEKARSYLENEMEKVRKVRADILQALEEADRE